MNDTCKEVVEGIVRRTVPRETVVDARGPWLFAREAMVAALERASGQEQGITDLVTLCRIANLRVRVLPEK
jgi:2-C-methyl-D-erythritol 4-phosphate cytidylyltransferase